MCMSLDKSIFLKKRTREFTNVTIFHQVSTAESVIITSVGFLLCIILEFYAWTSCNEKNLLIDFNSLAKITIILPFLTFVTIK